MNKFKEIQKGLLEQIKELKEYGEEYFERKIRPYVIDDQHNTFYIRRLNS